MSDRRRIAGEFWSYLSLAKRAAERAALTSHGLRVRSRQRPGSRPLRTDNGA